MRMFWIAFCLLLQVSAFATNPWGLPDPCSLADLQSRITNLAQISILDQEGRNLFQIASRSLGYDQVCYLLEMGFDPRLSDVQGQGSLELSLYNSDPRVFPYLLKQAVWTPELGLRLFYLAARTSPYTKPLETLALRINIREPWQGMPAIYQAVRWNPHPGPALWLIEQGASLKYRDSLGDSLVHAAARWNPNLSVLRALYENGADFRARTAQGESAFFLTCASSPDWKVYQYMLGKGGDQSDHDSLGRNTLMAAAGSNTNILIIRSLIELNTEIEARDKTESTALHYAAGFNPSLAVLQELLAAGASLESRSSAGWNAWLWAAGHNPQLNILKWLRRQGARLDDSDYDGNGTVLLAVREGQSLTVVQWLLEEGAPVNLLNRLEENVLHYAAARPGPELCALLIRYQARINQADIEGRTPLIRACMEGRDPQVIRLLLEKGAKTSWKDKSGLKAWDYARTNLYLSEVLSLLK